MSQMTNLRDETLSGTFQDIPTGQRECFPGISHSIQDVPQVAKTGNHIEFERPKPIPMPREPGARLSPRHLAAARWLARGMRSDEVAELLGTTRQTINAWRKLPGFAAELRRLHELLASAPSSPVSRPAPPAHRPASRRQRPVRSDDDEEIDQMMNRILSIPDK